MASEAIPSRRGSGLWMLALGLLAIVAVPTAYVAFRQYQIRTSEPFRMGLQRVRSSQKVQAALGEPIRTGLLVTESWSTDQRVVGRSGLAGPRGRGAWIFQAENVNGEWRFPQMEVWLPRGVRVIDLSDPPQAASLNSLQSLQARGRVIFAPLGHGAVGLAEQLQKKLSAKFGLPIELLPWVPVDVAEDPIRHQLMAEELIKAIQEKNPSLAGTPDAVVIGITDRDMFIRKRPDWRFAFSYRAEDRFAIVSTARMDPAIYEDRPDPELLLLRTQKMVTKSIGVLHYRLPLSNNPKSVLYGNVLGIQEVDIMGEDFLQTDLASGNRPH